jgi:hypothetical protein
VFKKRKILVVEGSDVREESRQELPKTLGYTGLK